MCVSTITLLAYKMITAPKNKFGSPSLYSPDQGMYKNRVENNIKKFEIPALLFWKRGNSAENREGKLKNNNVILNFPALDFHVPKIKEREFQKIVSFSLPYLYTHPASDHFVPAWIQKRFLFPPLQTLTEIVLFFKF